MVTLALLYLAQNSFEMQQLRRKIGDMNPFRIVALLALVSLAMPAGAQAPPPAAEITASSLTKDEREQAINYLNQTRQEFLSAVKGLSEVQWKFKPAPDRWSIAEAAEHIALTEERIWKLVSETIMKSPALPDRRGEVKGKTEIILKAIPDRSRKAEAPEQLRPTGKWKTQAELVKDFEATRDAEIAFLRETQEDLRSRFEEHPFLKAMDAWQWLLFNGAHSKRHTAQILEVKADPKFPKR